MKARHLIAIFGLALVIGFAFALVAQAQVTPPNYWQINTGSSTISPRNSALQLPCANIVGGCSGGSGSSTYSRAVTVTVCASNALDTKNCDYFATATSSDIAIQAALNAVSSTGGQVVLSQGTFGISTTTVIVASGTTITGQGPGGTILKADANLNGPIMENASETQNVIVQQIKFDGNAANNSSSIDFEGMDLRNSLIQNNWFTDTASTTGDCVFLNGDSNLGWYNSVINNDIDHCGGNGTHETYDEYNYLNGNTYSWITGNGNQSDSDHDQIVGNTFDEITGFGTYNDFGVGAYKIENNKFSRSATNAIELRNISYSLISGNTCDQLASGADCISNGEFSGEAGSYDQFIGNTVTNTGYGNTIGISESSSSTNNVYVGNSLNGASTTYFLSAASVNYTIVDNSGVVSLGTGSFTNNSSGNTLNVTANTNTGSGASTNGNLFVNCSSDTAGLCENINQENLSLSNAQPLLYINAGSPDNTTASGTQTLASTTTAFNVASVSGFPTSGYLLVQQSTSASQNANGVLLQYTSVSSSPASFNGPAGTLYPVTGQTFSVVTGDKVYYVNDNDHQVSVMNVSYGLNGAATPQKFYCVGDCGQEWTNGALNNASGSGQFQIDMPNAYGTNPQTADELGVSVRNQTNSAFYRVFGVEGSNEQNGFCFGDCTNNQTPWNAPWEGIINVYPNSANGALNVSTTPEIVLRQPDVGCPDFVHMEASSSVRTVTIDCNGNVSTTGNFFANGIEIPTSTTTHSITVTTSTQTTVPAADSTSTLTTVTNSLTTSTAYSFQIPANKLGTAGAMYDIKESGEFVQNSGQTLAPYIVYLALNGVQVASATPQTLAGASSPTGTWSAEFTLANFGGATNTQIATINTFAQRAGSQLLPRTNAALASVDSTQPITVAIWISSASTTATESVTSGQVATQFIGSAPSVVTGVTYN